MARTKNKHLENNETRRTTRRYIYSEYLFFLSFFPSVFIDILYEVTMATQTRGVT